MTEQPAGQTESQPAAIDPVRLVIVAPPRCGAGLLQLLICTDGRWTAGTLHSALPAEPGPEAAPWPERSHRVEHLDLPAPEAATVDWSPKLALSIPAIAAADPQAKFIAVLRDQRPSVASGMVAWGSKRFITVPDLAGWWGDQWSLPLIPGWEALIGKPAGQVVATQWLTIANAMIDGLAGLDPSRWTTVAYEALIEEPEQVIARAMGELHLPWSAELPEDLPLSPNTVTRPGARNWSRNIEEIAVGLNSQPELRQRFLDFAVEYGRPGYNEPMELPRSSPLDNLVSRPSSGTPFASEHTSSFPELLDKAGCSVVITTYKSGHLILARAREGRLDTNIHSFDRPMGVAVLGPMLSIGTGQTIQTFWNQPAMVQQIDAEGRHDAVYMPRSVTFTGDIAIHEMEYSADKQLWFVNTRFSCLATQDLMHSFEPQWRPKWISALASEDRCHLNGLAMLNGQPKYVTALAQTDTPNGWREHKGTSGVIVDVTTDEVVVDGLSMPHSPRLHDGRLWVLQSGLGLLATVDPATGTVTPVAELPGFTRGLAFAGPYALVGLSQVRESVFSDLPITQRAAERNCGVWIVDTRNGQIAGRLKFSGAVQEIFDVKVLPGVRWPTMLMPSPSTASSFVLSAQALAQTPQAPKSA